MKFSTFLVLILWMFLQGMSSLASGYEMAQDVSFPEQCHGYCFSVLQPLIDHVLKLKEATDDNDKMKVEKIHSLELTINNLQSQLLKSETEIKNNVEQIKVKDEQIKQKDDQIKLKDDQIKQKDDQIKLKDAQIKNLRKQIKGKVGEIYGKVEEIKNLREDVKMISSLNSGSDDIFKMKVKGMEQFESPFDSSRWTVIQRRINGSVDFNRNWTDYKNGFGDERGSFFLGLNKIHLMTLAQPHELYIILTDVNGTTKYARYDDFEVGSENEAYKLKSLGEYSGTAGDSFSYHLDMKFSTLDRDNDMLEKRNCAEKHAGGWWFNACSRSSLNAKYYDDGKRTPPQKFGIHWATWKNYNDYAISLTFSQMMIRPKPL